MKKLFVIFLLSIAIFVGEFRSITSENFEAANLDHVNDDANFTYMKDHECTPSQCPDSDKDGFVVSDGVCKSFTNMQSGDCDDTDPSINPNTREICDDGIDNDCDALIDGEDTDSCNQVLLEHNSITEACFSCHDRITATGKAPTHIPSTNNCNDCHSTNAWVCPTEDHFCMKESRAEMQCFTCHNGITASDKPPTHIPSTNNCTDCHSTSGWIPLTQVDHTATIGKCSDCHNDIMAQGKPPIHIPSSDNCNGCHGASSWLPITQMDHTAVTGTCVDCHNGRIAEGKTSIHIPSSNDCNDCHTTTAWLSYYIDHALFSVECYVCHNGTTATGKIPSHVPSTNNCTDCHSTSGWIPLTQMDHASTIGTCSDCHNGITAEGKTPGHIISHDICNDCHTTTDWLQTKVPHSITFDTCSMCHNGTQVDGKPPTHINTTNKCEDCHSLVWFSVKKVGHTAVIGTCSECHNGVTAEGKALTHISSSDNCDYCHNTTSWISIGEEECLDADMDGYHDPLNPSGCVVPFNGLGFDCNDSDKYINPAATEICDDGVDNNCNGLIDEDCSVPSCDDADFDGYPGSDGQCDTMDLVIDCDDNNSNVNPDAAEICNDCIDNDCNGLIDSADLACMDKGQESDYDFVSFRCPKEVKMREGEENKGVKIEAKIVNKYDTDPYAMLIIKGEQNGKIIPVATTGISVKPGKKKKFKFIVYPMIPGRIKFTAEIMDGNADDDVAICAVKVVAPKDNPIDDDDDSSDD